jgi:hypothetical protein
LTSEGKLEQKNRPLHPIIVYGADRAGKRTQRREGEFSDWVGCQVAGGLDAGMSSVWPADRDRRSGPADSATSPWTTIQMVNSPGWGFIIDPDSVYRSMEK